MCFSGTVPAKFCEQNTVTARKPHPCCECRLPIRPGERYERTVGVWDGDFQSYATCEFCVWLRERVIGSESEAGCSVNESHPGFGFLYEALGEGHAEIIGLFDLERYEESRP